MVSGRCQSGAVTVWVCVCVSACMCMRVCQFTQLEQCTRYSSSGAEQVDSGLPLFSLRASALFSRGWKTLKGAVPTCLQAYLRGLRKETGRVHGQPWTGK